MRLANRPNLYGVPEIDLASTPCEVTPEGLRYYPEFDVCIGPEGDPSMDGLVLGLHEWGKRMGELSEAQMAELCPECRQERSLWSRFTRWLKGRGVTCAC